MIKFFKYLIFIVVEIAHNQAYAEIDYPTSGMVYNVKEDSAITYNCTKQKNGLLECDFVQTAVRKKGKAEDLEKKLLDAKKDMPAAIKDISKDDSCEFFGLTLKLLEGGVTAEDAAETAPRGMITDKKRFIGSMKEMTEPQKIDMIQEIGAMYDFCITKSEQSLLKLIKLGHEKEMKTCRVSSNPFKQSFKWIDDYSGKGTWVVDSQPSGPCGTIQLDRFETDQTESKFKFWKYVAKKAITNPKGDMLFPGLSCSGLDQNEYIYDWKETRNNKLDCQYIEFSHF